MTASARIACQVSIVKHIQLKALISQGLNGFSSYNDAGISDWKDTFYNNAPIGRIYTDAVKQIKPAYFGPLHATIENDIIVQLLNVDKHLKTHDEAWNDAVEQVKKDIISK